MNILVILSEYEYASSLGLGMEFTVLLWFLIITLGILSLFLGCWLIRVGLSRPKAFLVILGIWMTWFWIGLIYWLLLRDRRKEKLQSKQNKE